MNVIGHQNLYTKMVLIDQKLNALDKKVSGLDDKLDILIKLVSDNKEDCKKMSSHIDFIDSVYNKKDAIRKSMQNSFLLSSRLKIIDELDPKTIKRLRKFLVFLKSNPKIIDEFNEF